MNKYNVIFSRLIDTQLLYHFQFIANVSLTAAKRFRNDFASIIKRLEENPFQFSVDTSLTSSSIDYRRALFAKWYKVIFTVQGNTVYIDSIVDCRQDSI